jgi:hypothetical protein
MPFVDTQSDRCSNGRVHPWRWRSSVHYSQAHYSLTRFWFVGSGPNEGSHRLEIGGEAATSGS